MDELAEGIHYVGVQDWDRQLFDELIPLPDGTSYNSYIVEGSEKNVLIDTCDPPKEEEFLENLDAAGLEKLDYVVANHAEQDHSGCLPKVLELYPEAKVLCSDKCREFLQDLLHVPEGRLQVVEDGEELSIGGRTLRFIFAPWVHWPETILTYLEEDKILFSCDLFGNHMATNRLFMEGEDDVYLAAKRYYAEIMMPFAGLIKGHLEKVQDLEINMIATSHGPIYENPKFILDAYDKWVNGEPEDEAIIPYVSMHESTRHMVEHLVKSLTSKGVKARPFNLTKTDVGQLAMELVDAKTIVLATPTVLAGPHPSAVYAAYLINALRPKTKYWAFIGSYGWGGKTEETLKQTLSSLQAEYLGSVNVKGLATDEDLSRLDGLAEKIKYMHDSAENN